MSLKCLSRGAKLECPTDIAEFGQEAAQGLKLPQIHNLSRAGIRRPYTSLQRVAFCRVAHWSGGFMPADEEFKKEISEFVGEVAVALAFFAFGFKRTARRGVYETLLRKDFRDLTKRFLDIVEKYD